MKTVTHYDLYEAINEMNHRYENVQFYNTAGILDRTVLLGVNWGAIGTVAPEKAEAFAEKINTALLEVAENIQDPNTPATAKRVITVKIKLAPSRNRYVVNTSISVSTKLAPAEEVETEIITGMNLKTGGIEIAEYDANQGQLSLFESAQSGEEPEETKTGKPLNLKNRGKEQKDDTGEMVPGRDFDPDTGEVFKNTGRVVPINNKAAQA